jgi:hypothetical protein
MQEYNHGRRAGKRQSVRAPKRRRRAQVRHGKRLAPLRAIRAAQFYVAQIASGKSVTLQEAADSHGSCPAYVELALKIVKANDERLIDPVLHDQRSILDAAKSAWARVRIIEGLKAATPADLEAVFHATGLTSDLSKLLAKSSPQERTHAALRFGDANVIWGDMVVPLISLNAAA